MEKVRRCRHTSRYDASDEPWSSPRPRPLPFPRNTSSVSLPLPKHASTLLKTLAVKKEKGGLRLQGALWVRCHLLFSCHLFSPSLYSFPLKWDTRTLTPKSAQSTTRNVWSTSPSTSSPWSSAASPPSSKMSTTWWVAKVDTFERLCDRCSPSLFCSLATLWWWQTKQNKNIQNVLAWYC